MAWPDMHIAMLSANACERHGQVDPAENAAPDLLLVKPVVIATLVNTNGNLIGLTWAFAPGTGADQQPPAVRPATTGDAPPPRRAPISTPCANAPGLAICVGS